MTEEQARDFEARLRKVEEFILGQLNRLLDVATDHKERLEILEKHDEEFMSMVHSTCQIKDKEILAAKEEAIEHANNNHVQTYKILGTMFLLFISAVVYFNQQVQDRAIASQKNSSSIEAITHSLDKIDNKLDRLTDVISEHKISDKRNND